MEKNEKNYQLQVCVLAFFAAGVCSAANWFVATTGSDTSPDARFEFIEARPATGRVGGALSECRLPEIRFEGIPESAVCLGSDGLKPLDAPLPS